MVLGAADEELALRVEEATDGDLHVLPPGRLPSDPGRLFEQLVDGELPDVLVVGPSAAPVMASRWSRTRYAASAAPFAGTQLPLASPASTTTPT